MKDFKVVHARTFLRLRSVAPIRGFLPPSVAVTGDRLTSTDEVIYNDSVVDEFVIESDSRMIVRIPTSEVGKDLVSLRAVSHTPQGNGPSEIVTGLTPPMKTVSGLGKLIQTFVLLLKTNPGSDIFSPSSGGGVGSLVGKVTSEDHRSAASDLTLAIEKTKAEMTRLQAGKNIPSSEKLLSCELSNVHYDPKTTTLSATVYIENMTGEGAEVSIG